MHKIKANRQVETNFTPIRPYQAYMTIYSKPTCIHGNRKETHVYTRKNLRTGRKVHKIKANRQVETNFTPIKHYEAYMPPNPTQKQERKSNSNTLNAEKTTPKGQLLGTPQQSCQFYYVDKFLWLGVPQ